MNDGFWTGEVISHNLCGEIVQVEVSCRDGSGLLLARIVFCATQDNARIDYPVGSTVRIPYPEGR